MSVARIFFLMLCIGVLVTQAIPIEQQTPHFGSDITIVEDDDVSTKKLTPAVWSLPQSVFVVHTALFLFSLGGYAKSHFSLKASSSLHATGPPLH